MDYEKKDFRKLYEDLVKSEWFKKAYHDKSLGDCPFNIPELAESEDERIRKELVNFLQSPFIKENLTDEKVAPWIAYLEKQKEQKPASPEDMPYLTDKNFYEREPKDSFKYKLAEYMTKNCRKEESPDGYTYHISSESILEMAKEELIKRGELQKPAEWSKEDEETLNYIINVLDRFGFEEYCKSSRDQDVEEERFFYKEIQVLKKLKSLRPQPKRDCKDCAMFLNGKCTKPHWKPSEEQMEAFRSYIKYFQEKAEAAVGGWNNFDVMIRLYEQLKEMI